MFMLYFFFLADVFVTIIQTTNVLLALFRPVAAGIQHRRPFLPTEAISVSVRWCIIVSYESIMYSDNAYSRRFEEIITDVERKTKCVDVRVIYPHLLN